MSNENWQMFESSKTKMNDDLIPEEEEGRRMQKADFLNRLTNRIYWATAIILFGLVIIQVVIYFRK